MFKWIREDWDSLYRCGYSALGCAILLPFSGVLRIYLYFQEKKIPENESFGKFGEIKKDALILKSKENQKI